MTVAAEYRVATAQRAWASVAVALFPGAVVLGVASVNGGYFPSSWGWIGLVFAWALVIALGFEAVAIRRAEGAFVGALVGVLCWTALSVAWSINRTQTVLEVLRVLMLPLAVAAALVLVRSARLRLFVSGLLGGITVVCVYSLATRLFPDRLGSYDPLAGSRLSTPIGYWNALGIFAALGILLAVAFGRGGPRARAAAAVALVVFAPTLYFTFSRGSWLALGIGLLAAIALDPRRLELLGTCLALVPGPIAAVVVVSRPAALTHIGISVTAAAHAGHRAAATLLTIAVVAGLLAAASVRIGGRAAITEHARRIGNLALGALALVALVAVAAVGHGPVHLVERVGHAFAAPSPTTGGDLNKRLFSFSGSGRVELWHAAWHDALVHPVLGSGAGTFERYWLAHRPAGQKVRDAHNLYLQTLAELGPIGLVLLLTAFAIPLAAAVRARRHPLVPLLTGAYLAYVVHAAVDWDWQVPTVTLVSFFCGAAILIAARNPEDESRLMPRRLRYGALGVALALGAAAFVFLVGNMFLSRASAAASAGHWTVAARDAQRASSWLPWSTAPWQQLGEAQLAQGDTAAAQASFRTAIRKDSGDWSLWLDLARASTGGIQTAALAHAIKLDPLSPEISEFRSELGSQSGISITASAAKP